MSRTVISVCMAAAFGAATLVAQSTTATSTAQTQDRTMSKSSDLSVTGCLQKDASGGFVLSNAQIDAADKTTSSYGSTGTTGTTGSTATAMATTSTTATAATWKLDGTALGLEEHVGHKIQVTGKEKMKTPEPAATTGTTEAASAMDHSRSLDVKTVKMVASSCS